jgi:predicted nucleic acid-binding protein
VAVVVLDASVVIAFLDAADPLHTRARSAMAEHRGDQLVFPASAYAEALVMPYRRGPAAVERIDEFVRDFAVRIEPAGQEIAHRAARLRARHRTLRLPDALVLATGDLLEAHVRTGDQGWTKVSRRARPI